MICLSQSENYPLPDNAFSVVFFIFYNYVFTVQLVTAVFMFCGHLPQRSRFGARVAAYIAVLFAVSSVWYSGYSYPVWLTIIRYFVIFGLATGGIVFMYKSTVLQAILCGTGAYALQHFMYRLQMLALYLLRDAGIGYFEFIIRIVIWAAVYLAMYFIFIRRKIKFDANTCRKNFHVIIISLITTCTVVIISALFDKYGGSGIIYLICSAYSIISCLSIFVIIFWLLRNENLKADNQTLERMLQLKGEQLAASKQTVDIINVKCHDMRHQISRLRNHMTDEGLDELEHTIDIYDSSVKTGNNALDIVLAEKGLICTDKKIRLSCVADGSKIAFMNDADIYSLFGNALDNAIRACQALPEDRRVISINLKEAMGLVSVHIENYYSGELTFEDGLPKTTQEDNGYHGFGMRSISLIAEKYGGYMNVNADGGVFRLDISFPSA